LTTSEHAEWMSQPTDPLPPKRQRRKYRRYPRPECSPAQRAHSWSSNKAGAPSAGQRESYTLPQLPQWQDSWLAVPPPQCRVGMFKGSPTRLKRALAYLQNPPAKALGFRENEKEKVKP
jgi:hypothetical protein